LNQLNKATNVKLKTAEAEIITTNFSFIGGSNLIVQKIANICSQNNTRANIVKIIIKYENYYTYTIIYEFVSWELHIALKNKNLYVLCYEIPDPGISLVQHILFLIGSIVYYVVSLVS